MCGWVQLYTRIKKSELCLEFLDFASDTFRREQISEIMRYAKIDNGLVSAAESFEEFIETK
jgi:hypothetical protein